MSLLAQLWHIDKGLALQPELAVTGRHHKVATEGQQRVHQHIACLRGAAAYRDPVSAHGDPQRPDMEHRQRSIAARHGDLQPPDAELIGDGDASPERDGRGEAAH